jgi:glycosyltransferase involved in cell wall biosynthesis
MKIGLITQHLDLPVGIGIYTNALLEALAEVDRTNEYVVYTPRRPKRRNWPQNFTVKPFDVEQRRSRLAWWEHTAAPQAARADGVDLIHYFHPVSPLVPVRRPVVVTSHDAIAWVLPGYALPFGYDRLSRRALRNASHILVVSQDTKEDLHRALDLPLRKMTVVHEAAAVPPGRAVKKQPFWMFVGGTERRKNLQVVLEAFAEGDFPGTRIKVFGAAYDSPIHQDATQLLSILNPEQRKRVDLMGLVDNAKLDQPYRRAQALLFPSRYEGFGLPVLEAMGRGTPVIASNVSSLPEVAGGAALLVDPDDVHALCQDMRRIHSSAKLRKRLVAAGLRNARKFTWQKTARETIKVYKRQLV